MYIVCIDDISAHLTVTISSIYREQGTGQTLCKVYFYYFYVIKPETLYTPPTGASNPVIQFRAETACFLQVRVMTFICITFDTYTQLEAKHFYSKKNIET